jgi:hypothetical protein
MGLVVGGLTCNGPNSDRLPPLFGQRAGMPLRMRFWGDDTGELRPESASRGTKARLIKRRRWMRFTFSFFARCSVGLRFMSSTVLSGAFGSASAIAVQGGGLGICRASVGRLASLREGAGGKRQAFALCDRSSEPVRLETQP